MRRALARLRAFTLAEVMIAILFISIALFGYASLHIRLIHSGYKLGMRQVHQEMASQKMGEALQNASASPDPAPFTVPQTVTYCKVEERWQDRNGSQRILLDSCKGKLYQGW